MTQPFDMSLVQRGARDRRTPYHEATQRYGPAGFTVYNHMYFPIRFDSFEAEFDALLNGVTLWDVAVERCLEISGPDGFRFAQLLTPRDLSRCAVGQAKYVLICDSDGGIINDPVLTRMDENTFWFALASSDALLFARGLKNAYPDLDVTIKEADVAPLQVQGPRSKDLMVKLLGEDILDLRYYFWTDAKIAGVPVVVTRTGWISEIGYEVFNGVVFDGDPFPALNAVKWPASIDGQQVGKVTSAIYSPRLKLNIGYGWLPAGRSHEGQAVTVQTEWGTRTATVTPMPFVDPSKQIPVS